MTIKNTTKKNSENALKLLRLLGIALIIVGVLFILNDGDHTGVYGGVSRASTSIEFGADFYTTSAQYTGLAANALVDLYDLIQNSIGIFFVFLGAVDCGMLSFFKRKQQENIILKTVHQEPVIPNSSIITE